MIRMLSNIGRTVVALAAVAIIGVNTLGGYVVAVGTQMYADGSLGLSMPGQSLPFTSFDLFGALCGFVVGLFMAGLLLGLVATIYDMRDSLRALASTVNSDVTGGSSVRREPRLSVVQP